jgi:hypothetical protein
MEDPHLLEKYHRDPAALSLTDVCPKLNEQCLKITPRNIGPDRVGKDGFQGSLVPSSHRENSTTMRYYSQAPKHSAHRRRHKGFTLAFSRVWKQNRGASGVWRLSAPGPWSVSPVWVARLERLPQGVKVGITPPWIPLCAIMAPAHVSVLEAPSQADAAQRLAQGSQSRLAHLCERQRLGRHGDITSQSQANGCATRTRHGAVRRVPRRRTRSPAAMHLSPPHGVPRSVTVLSVLGEASAVVDSLREKVWAW